MEVSAFPNRYKAIAGLRPAYVLHTRAIGLGVARSLAMKGVPIIAVDYNKDAIGIRSRSFSKHLALPDIEKAPAEAVEALIDIQKRVGERGVLFSTSDAFTLWLSRNRRKLAAHFDMAVPSEEILEGIMDKKRQYQNAMGLGVPIPETHFPASMEELEAIIDQIGFPALIKPCYSHMWQQVFENKGFQVFDREELRAKFRLVLDSRLDTEVMVQRVIVGPNTNLRNIRAYIDQNGEVHGALEAQKVRQYPVDFGVGTLNRTMHNQRVRELGIRFMKGIGYRGLGAVEFKYDPLDGEFKMMELNARVGKTIGLSTKAGVNLPWLMYQDLTGMEIDADPTYEDYVRWHDFMNDCRAYMTLRSRGETSFKEWMRSIIGAECHVHFDWSDLRPCLDANSYGLKPAKELFYVLVFNAGQVLRGRGKRKGA